jgi:putative hydrolase of the HAD superfamily
MKTKAIIFDLFHTLISLKSDGVAQITTSEQLGVSEKQWNTLLWEQSGRRLRGHVKDPFEIIKELITLGGWDIPDSQIRKVASDRQQRFADGMHAVQPHVLEVLDKLKQAGLLLAICSNADCMERKGWDGSPLSERFDTVIFSCDVGYVKPEPEIYQLCLDELNVKAQETVFVGDGGSNELAGAKEMGMTAVMTTEITSRIYPEVIDQRKQDADHIINHITELMDIIN